jgi:hypothetical protein
MLAILALGVASTATDTFFATFLGTECIVEICLQVLAFLVLGVASTATDTFLTAFLGTECVVEICLQVVEQLGFCF